MEQEIDDDFTLWVEQTRWMHKPLLYRLIRNDLVFTRSLMGWWAAYVFNPLLYLLLIVLFPAGILFLVLVWYAERPNFKELARIKRRDWQTNYW